MHGPSLEKQNYISSKTHNNQTWVEKTPSCLCGSRVEVPGVKGTVLSVTRSGGTCLGDGPQGGVGFPHPLICLDFWMLPTMQLWINLSTSLLPHPSSFGGHFHPHFAGFSLFFCLFFPPSSPFSLRKAWLGHGAKNPTSSQLPALPLAYCSSFMFDSNPTIYNSKKLWAKPKVSGTCQKPQLFLKP